MATTTRRRTARDAGRTPHPKSTLLLLVRHGRTPTTGKVLPGRAPGLHLSDKGQAEASKVASRLSAWAASGNRNGPEPSIAAVYSSPLERTRETAARIAAELGMRVQVSRGLLECDFGNWTGAELKKLMKLPEWATVQRYPSGFRFPGGESFQGMQARTTEAVAGICARHPGQAVVAVSHADPIKALVSNALGSHLDLMQRIVISPCSVTAISYSALGPTVLTVNSTESLAELIPS